MYFLRTKSIKNIHPIFGLPCEKIVYRLSIIDETNLIFHAHVVNLRQSVYVEKSRAHWGNRYLFDFQFHVFFSAYKKLEMQGGPCSCPNLQLVSIFFNYLYEHLKRSKHW